MNPGLKTETKWGRESANMCAFKECSKASLSQNIHLPTHQKMPGRPTFNHFPGLICFKKKKKGRKEEKEKALLTVWWLVRACVPVCVDGPGVIINNVPFHYEKYHNSGNELYDHSRYKSL